MGIKCPKCQTDNPDTLKSCKECGAELLPTEEDSVSRTKTLQKPVSELASGSTFAGRYIIAEVLGKGGMGVVYKAEDTKLKRTVALKFLPPELTSDPEAKERFIREARAAAALDHPHICTVHEIDDAEGKTFISMAYVEGESLRERIKSGPLKLDESLEIILQVAEGLEEAHKKGVIHRDIKSANIMVDKKGKAKVMDFGLAKVIGETLITKEAKTMGTVAYMSPEQARGEAVDHRTDIWSLGVVLYEMISGHLPFQGERETSVMYSIIHEEPKPLRAIQPDIPEELEQVVGKALTKNADERYQKMDELLDDLFSISKGFVPPKIKAAIRRARLSKIKRAYFYAGVTGFVVLMTVIILSLFTGHSRAIDSIAVLPLKNLSGDPDQEYLSDGITDALINELAKISALHRVISRQSMMQYKGLTKSMPEIAQELNVDAVVEASVLNIGSKVQIRARLIFARKEENLWAQSYEREMSDILVLQSEMAQAIAEEIKVKLTPEELVRLASARPVNPEAHEAYLKGLYHWNRRTPQDQLKATQYFEEAIRKDRTYAPAYAGLADTYAWSFGRFALPPRELYPKARELVLKALELDDRLAEAHASLAFIKDAYDWDWAGAEKEYKRAIELNPSYASAHAWYALFLSFKGRFEEAFVEIKRAEELDPLSLPIKAQIGWLYFWASQFDRAIEQWRKTLELDPNFPLAHYNLGLGYVKKGMYEEAIGAFRKAIALGGEETGFLLQLAYAYARAGQKAEALRILAKLNERSKREYVPSTFMALLHLGLGNKEQAFELLEKAYQERDPNLSLLKLEPWGWKPLRSDPRFQDLLKRMSFPKNEN